MRSIHPVLLCLLLATGCTPAPGGSDTDTNADSDSPSCPTVAVVTDIDETLTTSDEEWLAQILDPSYDPAMRPDANTLMQRYAEAGLDIYYVTARGEDMTLLDGTSARDATEAWLAAHDFPQPQDHVFLAPGIGASGNEVVAYKAGVIDDAEAAGWSFAWGYGNAETDIEAFLQAGMPGQTVFFVGDLSTEAADYGVQPIANEDAYTNHLAAQTPSIVPVDCP